MRKKAFLAFCVFVAVVFCQPSAWAVDGYKDLLFGSAKSDILNKPGYTFVKSEIDQPGVEFYGCTDFKFGNQIVEAGACFVDGKFLRFIIVVPVDQVTGILDGLKNKYGSASSSSPKEAFEAVDAFPNSEAFLAFDNDTVYLKISSDARKQQSAILIYTSPEYDQHLVKMQRQGVENDL